VYFWCLGVVFTSATALSIVRWKEDYHLFSLGGFAFIAALYGRSAMKRRWRTRVRHHICGMGASYILLLTAFYVDNGHSLPGWRDLPVIAYWTAPAIVGIPIIVWAILRHPLARRRRAFDASTARSQLLVMGQAHRESSRRENP
jgi:hypothetical protein